MSCLSSLECRGSLCQLAMGSPILLLLSTPSLLLPISFPAGWLVTLAHLLFPLTQLHCLFLFLCSPPHIVLIYHLFTPAIHTHTLGPVSLFPFPATVLFSISPSHTSPLHIFTSLCSSSGSSTVSPFTPSTFGSIHYFAVDVRLEDQLQQTTPSIVLQTRGPWAHSHNMVLD